MSNTLWKVEADCFSEEEGYVIVVEGPDGVFLMGDVAATQATWEDVEKSQQFLRLQKAMDILNSTEQ